jgi:hypothetical protein
MRTSYKFRVLPVVILLSFCVAGASRPVSAQSSKAPAPRHSTRAAAQADAQALRYYVLTRYKVRELGEAISDLGEYQDAHPDVASAMTAEGSQGDIAHLAQRIQKFPQVVALLRKDGFTPRQYVTALMTLEQAMQAVTAKLNGAYPDYPPQTANLIGRPNLTFVERNLDELAHIIDSLGPLPDQSPAASDSDPGLFNGH